MSSYISDKILSGINNTDVLRFLHDEGFVLVLGVLSNNFHFQKIIRFSESLKIESKQSNKPAIKIIVHKTEISLLNHVNNDCFTLGHRDTLESVRDGYLTILEKIKDILHHN